MLSGFGSPLMQAAAGFGAIDFNGPAVWSAWKAGGASGAEAARSIQAALNQLGYGPLTVDGQFGGGSLAAWKRFANANGTGDAAWPSQTGILKLGEMVAVGGNQGGGPIVESHIVAGQFVPGAAPGTSPIGTSKAAMTSGEKIGLVVAGVAVVAALAIVAKKKKAQGGYTPAAA